MNRPAWRDNRLPIADNNVSCFLRLSAKMKYPYGLIDIVVHVDFHAAFVGMRRHGIPDTALCQFGYAHDQLTAFDAIGMDIFVNCPFIGFLYRTQMHRLGLALSY